MKTLFVVVIVAGLIALWRIVKGACSEPVQPSKPVVNSDQYVRLTSNLDGNEDDRFFQIRDPETGAYSDDVETGNGDVVEPPVPAPAKKPKKKASKKAAKRPAPKARSHRGRNSTD